MIGDEAAATSAPNGANEQTPLPPGDASPAREAPSHANDNAAKDVTEAAQDNSTTNQDEHDDHIVEGEEDTVIY